MLPEKGSDKAHRLVVLLGLAEEAVMVRAVEVLHVIEPSARALGGTTQAPSDPAAAREQLRQFIASTLGNDDPQPAERVDTGDVRDRIVTLAEDGGFDLIVMGTHGRTGIKHVLLGSVAEKVVRHAPCPVLAVRVRD
jgi:nucleotide-binding universal stress UspA family protein